MAFPDGWNKKAKITIQSSKIDSTLTNFPVQLTRNSLPSDMLDADGVAPCQADGGDIRFSSDAEGTTQLPCEVSYINLDNDPASSNINLFVKIPSISSSVDTDFYVWFNAGGSEVQPAASDTYGSQNVWDANYEIVLHLDEAVNNSAGGYPDSTVNANNATGTSMALSAVEANGGGLAQDFDGTADYITVPPPSINTAFTMSFLVNHDTLGTQKYMSEVSGGKYWEIFAVASGAVECLWNWSINSPFASSGTPLTTGNWEYVTVTGSAADGLKFILDGAEDSNPALGTYAGIGTYVMGRREGGSNYFNGKMGEHRVSNIVRSVAWCKAEYENFKNNAEFVVASATESVGGGGTPQQKTTQYNTLLLLH